jgi:hypothetical protein
LTPYDSELAEVPIESYENAIFAMTVFQDFFLSGILRPVASPEDIVAGRLEGVAYSS